jgi:hypothetical protein
LATAKRPAGAAVATVAILSLVLGGCSGSMSGGSTSSGAMSGDSVMKKDTTMEGTTRPGMR